LPSSSNTINSVFPTGFKVLEAKNNGNSRIVRYKVIFLKLYIIKTFFNKINYRLYQKKLAVSFFFNKN